MADWGIKISKKGFDVKTARDRDLVLSSKFSTLKVAKSGFLTLVTDGSGVGKTGIKHNLGYAPGHIAMVNGDAYWDYDEVFDSTTYSDSYINHLGTVNFWTKGLINHAITSYTTADELIVEASAAADNASKTIRIKYLIFADPAQTVTNISSQYKAEHGLNISQTGYNVLTAGQQEMAYTSKFKTLQYYPGNIINYSVTLPVQNASRADPNVEAMTWVDFYHNLGYPPLFFFWFTDTTYAGGGSTLNENSLVMGPFMRQNGLDAPAENMAGFCNKTKIRLSFWRWSTYSGTTLYGDYSSETIKFKLFVFAEDLRKNYG